MKIYQNKKLDFFSTFAIGGDALYFIEVFDFLEMKMAFSFAKEKRLPFFILGKGSNVLFDDRGFKGVIIKNNIKFLTRTENYFIIGSGNSLSFFAKKCAMNNLSGLEFAFGIPATIGGAICMNASAKEMEISKSLESVFFMHENNSIEEIKKKDVVFEYRKSSFQKMKGAIIAAKFKLKKNNSANKILLEGYIKRKLSQPLKSKSLGCIFRNPVDVSAGKLIELCGLKNTKIGDAVVSSKHANFILNESRATSFDVRELIEHIKKIVEEKKHIKLKEEIIFLPYE